MSLVEVQYRVGQCLFGTQTAAAATFTKQPVNEYEDTPCQDCREDKVCKDANVRAWGPEAKTQQEEKEDQHDADQDDQASEVTDRVSVKTAQRHFLVHGIPFSSGKDQIYQALSSTDLTTSNMKSFLSQQSLTDQEAPSGRLRKFAGFSSFTETKKLRLL
jgi:hypothetical protein